MTSTRLAQDVTADRKGTSRTEKQADKSVAEEKVLASRESHAETYAGYLATLDTRSLFC
jgi:hypothetical protein